MIRNHVRDVTGCEWHSIKPEPRLKPEKGGLVQNERSVVLIDDMRFPNEFDAFMGSGVLRIRLECDEEVRKERCSMWRENTQHPSEISLDDKLESFDLIVRTEKDPEGVTAKIVEKIQGIQGE